MFFNTIFLPGKRFFIPKIFLTSESSVLFSMFHYLGEETFTPYSFTLRFIAGIYLSSIYINRGFGIVALTHAFYDLFVIFRLT